MKLYRSRDLPGRWVGEDKHGALVHWPAESGGWAQRTPYTGGKRQLEEVDPRLARGSGWPGGGTGRPPRQGSPARTFGIRASADEITAWKRRAGEEHKKPTVWARDELNAAVERSDNAWAANRGQTEVLPISGERRSPGARTKAKK